MIKIVILDGYTLNPGDLDWSGVQALGQLEVYDRTPPNLIVERAKEADIVLTNKTPLSAQTLLELPQLKFIGVMATGVNVVDVKAASEKNILVSNVPNYGATAVAQHTFALILALTNHVEKHNQSVKAGKWANNTDWCYWEQPIQTLHNHTLGIVGLGNIGKNVAKIALGFGMKVQAFHPHPERDKMEGVTFVTLSTLFQSSDIVSLHCPLTSENKAFVNTACLSQMKKSAFLINTSRGGLIDEMALAQALENKQIAGAAVDVLSQEPPQAENPLLTVKNCIITPHNAWAAVSSRQKLLDILKENIEAFLTGSPQNIVS